MDITVWIIVIPVYQVPVSLSDSLKPEWHEKNVDLCRVIYDDVRRNK